MKTIELTDEERRWLFKEIDSTLELYESRLKDADFFDRSDYEKDLYKKTIRISKSILEKL